MRRHIKKKSEYEVIYKNSLGGRYSDPRYYIELNEYNELKEFGIYFKNLNNLCKFVIYIILLILTIYLLKSNNIPNRIIWR